MSNWRPSGYQRRQVTICFASQPFVCLFCIPASHNLRPEATLGSKDYKAKEKSKAGPTDAEFLEYAPAVFAALRRQWGLAERLPASLAPEAMIADSTHT